MYLSLNIIIKYETEWIYIYMIAECYNFTIKNNESFNLS